MTVKRSCPLLAAVLTVCTLTACGSAHNAHSASSSHHAVSHATGHPASLKDRMHTWYAGVQGDLLAVQGDETSIAAASSSENIPGLNSACSSLKADVRQFEGDPPAPDPQVRRDLAEAMDSYSSSATSCLAGDYETSASLADDGTTHINDVVARIQAINAG